MHFRNRTSVLASNGASSWVLRDLFHKFAVSRLKLDLDDQGSQRHTQRFDNIAGVARKKLSIFYFEFIPWDTVSHFDSPVILIHFKPHGLVKIKKQML